MGPSLACEGVFARPLGCLGFLRLLLFDQEVLVEELSQDLFGKLAPELAEEVSGSDVLGILP